MSDCLNTGKYVTERDFLKSKNQCSHDLVKAWSAERKNVVTVSGQLETGGGVVLSHSMLPHIHISNQETFILTAAHIVDKKRTRLVGTYNSTGELGSLYPAEVIAIDKRRDLALLRVSLAKDQRPSGISFADLSAARPKEATIAFRPEDETRSLAIFQVWANTSYGSAGGAAIRKRFPVVSMSDQTAIVLLRPADEPRTSGSPVISKEGKILGLVSQRIPQTKPEMAVSRNNKPLWTSTAVVSSATVKGFLLDVDRHKILAKRTETIVSDN